MSSMPAVRIFSLYAAAAVFFDFLLQVTAFVALLSLDSKRQENNRLDLICCIKEPKLNSSSEPISCNVYIVMKYFADLLLFDFVRPVVVSTWTILTLTLCYIPVMSVVLIFNAVCETFLLFPAF